MVGWGVVGCGVVGAGVVGAGVVGCGVVGAGVVGCGVVGAGVDATSNIFLDLISSNFPMIITYYCVQVRFCYAMMDPYSGIPGVGNHLSMKKFIEGKMSKW